MSEFYIIIPRKIFFPNFRGHVPPSAPVSYAYGDSLILRPRTLMPLTILTIVRNLTNAAPLKFLSVPPKKMSHPPLQGGGRSLYNTLARVGSVWNGSYV